MERLRLIEWMEAYVIGVASAITASLFVFLFRARAIARKALKVLIGFESSRRFRKLRRNRRSTQTDSHTLIREEWAYALRDLGSKSQDEVFKAIQALSEMADLLDTDEKEVAHEALRLRYAMNPLRSADISFLDAMRRLRA